MKAFITTNKYLEKISEIEIKELINCQNFEIYESVVSFDIKNYVELAKITYYSQSINRACLLLEKFKIEENKEINNLFKKIEKKIEEINFLNLKELINNKSFKVECERHGNHDFKSTDIEILVGKKLNNIFKDINIKNNVDYDNPEVIFFFYIYNEYCFFGLDFSGFDLSKRQYKIFNHPESLKGNVAYSLIRLSEFKKNDFLLDPFMGSGTIVIEAALYATGFPVQYYNKDKLAFTRLINTKLFDKEKEKIENIKEKKTNIYGYDYQMKYLKAAQKNAKLAGIDKTINLSRCEIEWLDTKIKEKSFDFIITDMPRYSKNKPEKEYEKLYDEFFYQAKYILKNKGRIVLLTKENEILKKSSEKHNFKIVNKYFVSQGQEVFDVFCFEKEIRQN
ncbi:MAG: THUMP domain-containing protein [Candidatus Woesearchaeota archaeon]